MRRRTFLAFLGGTATTAVVGVSTRERTLWNISTDPFLNKLVLGGIIPRSFDGMTDQEKSNVCVAVGAYFQLNDIPDDELDNLGSLARSGGTRWAVPLWTSLVDTKHKRSENIRKLKGPVAEAIMRAVDEDGCLTSREGTAWNGISKRYMIHDRIEARVVGDPRLEHNHFCGCHELRT
jgi:hypothetical protein